MPVTLLLLLASALLHLRYIGAAIRTELHRPPRLVSRRLVDAVGTFLPFGVRFSLSDQRPGCCEIRQLHNTRSHGYGSRATRKGLRREGCARDPADWSRSSSAVQCAPELHRIGGYGEYNWDCGRSVLCGMVEGAPPIVIFRRVQTLTSAADHIDHPPTGIRL